MSKNNTVKFICGCNSLFKVTLVPSAEARQRESQDGAHMSRAECLLDRADCSKDGEMQALFVRLITFARDPAACCQQHPFQTDW